MIGEVMAYNNRDKALKKLTERVDVRLFASKQMDAFRQDREFVLEIVKLNGKYLADVGGDLMKDKALVMEAVKSNGAALVYAHVDLRDDNEVVLAALKQNERVLDFASPRIRDMCYGIDPIKSLESTIAYEKMQSMFAHKAEDPKKSRPLKL